MGIGRFAFTPLLPMMLADGVVNLPTASWLASANYLGYLVGALLCTLQPWAWRRFGPLPPLRFTALVRAGLAATCVLTLGMALHWPGAWGLLRFAAGVASALVFVYTSGWCLGQLARLGVPSMGAVIYTGPGAGIVLSGLAASGMVVLVTRRPWGTHMARAEAARSGREVPEAAEAMRSTASSGEKQSAGLAARQSARERASSSWKGRR